MYQEKLSAMLLDNNFRLSRDNQTKYICVRYLLIKYRIAMGEPKIKYCPMGKMLAGHFTKPLQGASFHKFRSEIQGIPEEYPDRDLGWDRPTDMFIPRPNECAKISGTKTETRAS